MTLAVYSSSPEETQEVGRTIGEQARPGDIYLLTGPLGAGKTCLTQGIARGLGVAEHARSPTFVLMTRYQGRLTLYHLDLYRIGGPLEAWDLGIEEQLLGEGVCVVEWADQAEEIFPPEALWIALDYAGPHRDLSRQEESHQPHRGKEKAGLISERAGGALEGGVAESACGDREYLRTITFGNHSSRYDSLLEILTRRFTVLRNCT